jgi:nucleoside-diphosphate-sugar epimerase
MTLGKLLVVGGRGYVGNHILRKAGMMGINSTSVSRSPVDSITSENPNISFISGDALNPETFEEAIKEADTISKSINPHYKQHKT